MFLQENGDKIGNLLGSFLTSMLVLSKTMEELQYIKIFPVLHEK
jgi:hypothetical protein